MIKKIRDAIQMALFLYTLVRSAQGLALFGKDLGEELAYQIRRRKTPAITRYSHKNKD